MSVHPCQEGCARLDQISEFLISYILARGERENALQCKYNGGVVPLGFTIGKEDRLYHIDPETAPIVQEIFTRYADGEPAEKIAASLNERGLRTRTGKPFVKNSFFQIFRNRRYIGEYRYKDIVTPGGIPVLTIGFALPIIRCTIGPGNSSSPLWLKRYSGTSRNCLP